ncbi:MAG: amidohydrolase family protein [Sphingomonadales bacterium]|jgi:imidazolonepropionase-like amidohydrolase
MKKLLATALVATFITSPVGAETLAVVNGKVHTVSKAGVIENGTVLIEDGKITAVGSDVSVPEGAQVIDASDKWVTPGIFNPVTQLGANEGPFGTNSDDTSAEKAPFSAAFDVQYGINPFATAIPISRIEGVTRAAVHPGASSSIFEGYGALIHLGGGSDVVFQSRSFASLALGEAGAQKAGGARGAAWVTLFGAFDEAQGAGKSSDHDNLLPRLDKEAILPIVQGKTALVISVDRASDILNVIKLKAKYPKLKPIIMGAAEGWLVADELAEADIPVITDTYSNLPGSFETLGATQENAARLSKAGVRVAIAPLTAVGGFTANARLILQYAGNAVAHGMDWNAALKAITLIPAQIYGVGQSLGSLETGKIADVVVWDGDPLELSSSPTAVIINGVQTPLTSRQIELRDRYQDLDGSKPFSYRY